MSDKKTEEKKSQIGTKKKIAIFTILVCVAVVAYRPSRVWLCQNANICIRSCEEYSGKPVYLKTRAAHEEQSCEQEEAVRNHHALSKTKQFFGFPEDGNPLNLKPMKLKEPLSSVQEKARGGDHE